MGDSPASQPVASDDPNTSQPILVVTRLGKTSALLNDQERARILSTTRLKVLLSIFVVALLLGLGSLAFIQVTRIFDELTPAVAKDLSCFRPERTSTALGLLHFIHG